MSFKFGRASRQRLETVHPLLRQIIKNVLKMQVMDMTVMYGVREKEAQNEMFKKGLSKKQWPNSKHNILKDWHKSLAADVGPFINGKISRIYTQCSYLAGYMMGEAYNIGVKMRWGGDWDMDGEAITDQDFQDLYHYEIILEDNIR